MRLNQVERLADKKYISYSNAGQFLCNCISQILTYKVLVSYVLIIS